MNLPENYIPILIQAAVGLGFVIVSLLGAHFLGPKVKSEVKDQSWECGVESVGNARTPFSVKYFLTAILFVLFDIEIVFLYPWAVHFGALGLFGLLAMALFIVNVSVAYAYEWRRGGLSWD